MKRILMRAGKSPFEVVTPAEAIQRNVHGTNAGNLLFSDAAYKMLATPDTEITPTHRFSAKPEDAGRINEQYDVLVLPFANAFRLSFEGSLRSWTKLIERLKIPVVVLGIGAQGDLDYNTDMLAPIEDSVKRFAKAVLKRSGTIGVRGECTRKYLNDLGFNDVEVIGCPSMFLYGDSLNVQKKLPALDAESKVSVSMSRSAIGTGDIAGIVAANYERYPHLYYVAQELKDLELLYWGDTSQEAGKENPMPVNRNHVLFRENRTRFYIDPPTWLDDLADYDFAFGTRIHGNMAALLAGTPSVVLCHDSRTLELCEYFEIPHRRIPELPSDVDAAELYDKADYTAMLDGHRERFERFTAFLDAHDLDHVHAPGGDKGASFEARIRETNFPPPVQAWTGEDDGGLGYRLGWLKESAGRLSKQHEEAQQRVAELTERVERLEQKLRQQGRQIRNTPYYRARKLAGRALRRVTGRS